MKTLMKLTLVGVWLDMVLLMAVNLSRAPLWKVEYILRMLFAGGHF